MLGVSDDAPSTSDEDRSDLHDLRGLAGLGTLVATVVLAPCFSDERLGSTSIGACSASLARRTVIMHAII